jgi:hypothetical protein
MRRCMCIYIHISSQETKFDEIETKKTKLPAIRAWVVTRLVILYTCIITGAKFRVVVYVSRTNLFGRVLLRYLFEWMIFCNHFPSSTFVLISYYSCSLSCTHRIVAYMKFFLSTGSYYFIIGYYIVVGRWCHVSICRWVLLHSCCC